MKTKSFPPPQCSGSAYFSSVSPGFRLLVFPTPGVPPAAEQMQGLPPVRRVRSQRQGDDKALEGCLAHWRAFPSSWNEFLGVFVCLARTLHVGFVASTIRNILHT